MRFRLLRRRLTISAPRMAVRSAMPWPLRWALAALALGFCAALALWAFELGKDIAGLNRLTQEEFARTRAELERTRSELEQLRSQANASVGLLAVGKAAEERLASQIKRLESENRILREDLGFFETLIPAAGQDGVTIRGFQAERLGSRQLRWQVLVIQPRKNAPAFKGDVQITVAGILNGKPWAAAAPLAHGKVDLLQYQRLDGVLDLPEQVNVQSVTARLLEGEAVRSVQTVNL